MNIGFFLTDFVQNSLKIIGLKIEIRTENGFKVLLVCIDSFVSVILPISQKNKIIWTANPAFHRVPPKEKSVIDSYSNEACNRGTFSH